ncbi:hypothetical protein [Streptomyces sp. NRRL S-244]|uniref:hypothetical protein n=1 Tax=Streptomyces sp. NRRL S-244 TaxID=1463897 RepID=UPI0004C18120|nr:hypothetical protein [Streptomyces sp. NRRL S-244]
MRKALNAPRVKRWSKLAAIPVGVLASGAMVLGATHATVTASTWNQDNTLEAGKWTKADVTSNKPSKSFINAKGLKPGSQANAMVTYTFAPDASEVPGSLGQVLLKNIVAKDAQGNRLSDAATSELAKHLHLGFNHGPQADPNDITQVEHTAAEWVKAGSNGANVIREGILLDKDKTKNKYEVQVTWSLDKDAPAEAQNCQISFDLGAEVDVERDR